MVFYIGFGMQLMGFTFVGLCLFAGINKGDYGQLELLQLVGGSLLFYLGHFVKSRGDR
jgi:threonine/homoserine/homoserine lactone efflux protein